MNLKIIRLAVMLDIRYPLSLRNVEDLLHERGIDITHETVRFDAPPLSLSGVSSTRPDGRWGRGFLRLFGFV